MPVALALLTQCACTEHSPATSMAAPEKGIIAHQPPAITTSVPEEVTPQPTIDLLALEHDSPSVDHLAASQSLKASGDVAAALDEARRALYASPNDEDALVAVARLASKQKKFALSAEAWDRLATLHADDAMPRIENARALLALKKPELAMAAAMLATQIDAENAEAFHVVGRARIVQEQWAQAIVALKQAVLLNPQHGWAHNNLGFAYLRTNQNDKAATVLERAVALLPNSGKTFNTLGVALERSGRFESAREAYSRASELSPHYVKAQLNADRLAQLDVDQHPMLDETQPSIDSSIDAFDVMRSDRIDPSLE